MNIEDQAEILIENSLIDYEAIEAQESQENDIEKYP
jgi:hypothetical protein